MTKINISVLKMVFLSCFVLLIGCDRYDYKNNPTYYMDQEFKDYVLFPLGSYWVYSNTKDNNLDSVRVIKHETGVYIDKISYPYNTDYFNQHKSSSYYQDTLMCGGSPIKMESKIPSIFYERYLSAYMISGVQFFSLHQVGDTLNFSEDSKVKYIEYYPELTVNGTVYKEVMGFENLYILPDDRLPHRIYYARHVGVVRKELFDGTIWQLMRYHINN